METAEANEGNESWGRKKIVKWKYLYKMDELNWQQQPNNWYIFRYISTSLVLINFLHMSGYFCLKKMIINVTEICFYSWSLFNILFLTLFKKQFSDIYFFQCIHIKNRFKFNVKNIFLNRSNVFLWCCLLSNQKRLLNVLLFYPVAHLLCIILDTNLN